MPLIKDKNGIISFTDHRNKLVNDPCFQKEYGKHKECYWCDVQDQCKKKLRSI